MKTEVKKIDSCKAIKKMLTKEERIIAEYYGMKMYVGAYYNTNKDKEECMRKCEARVKAIRKSIAGKIGKQTPAEWVKCYKKRVSDEKRAEAKKARECEEIKAMLQKNGLYGYLAAINTYRTGENVDGYNGEYSQWNEIEVSETRERYSSRCRYTKVSRYFTLNVRKGWNIRRIGGLLTFYKGEFDRTGMPCEWIEQGREISNFTTVSGYLVRGEHIRAKSLKEAVRINDEHRAMQLARLLSQRKKVQRRQEQKENGTLAITFSDSIASGNCRPGTQHFKQQYEEAVGHKVNSITISELRKYGKQFGVEYYAERAINYAINH